MTKQITIKLNEKKFRPILDALHRNCAGIPASDSELVGLALFHAHLFCTQKHPSGKTYAEWFAQQFNMKKDEAQYTLMTKYKQFQKKGLK